MILVIYNNNVDITAIVEANMSETEKCKRLVIRKSKQLRYFEKNNVELLPDTYAYKEISIDVNHCL